MKRTLFAATAVVLVVAFLVAAWWYRDQRAQRLDFLAQEQAELFVRPDSPVLGAEDARVYLVEFTDPACETCAAFGPIVKQFIDRYDGQVQLVVRWAPFHQGSSDIVRVLEAARMQGQLWETLDLLYSTQRTWTQNHRVVMDRVWPLLAETDLDLEQLRRDMGDPRITAILQQDLADARALGVQRTPGFFVNGRPLEPFGVEPLAQLIAEEVRESYPE